MPLWCTIELFLGIRKLPVHSLRQSEGNGEGEDMPPFHLEFRAFDLFVFEAVFDVCEFLL